MVDRRARNFSWSRIPTVSTAGAGNYYVSPSLTNFAGLRKNPNSSSRRALYLLFIPFISIFHFLLFILHLLTIGLIKHFIRLLKNLRMALPGAGVKKTERELYNKYHKNGFELMSKALTIDEGGNHDPDSRQAAIDLYLQGIAELEHGLLAIEQLPSSLKESDEDRYERAQRLKEKIQANLQSAKERVEELGSHLENSHEVASPKTRKDKVPTITAKPRHVSVAVAVNRKFNHAAKIAPSSPTRHSTTQQPDQKFSRPSSQPNNANSREGRLTLKKPLDPSTIKVQGPFKPRSNSKPDAPPPSTPRSQRKGLGALKNVDNNMAQLILDQIIDNSPGVSWDAIAGQETAKQALMETVVWPALSPEIFTGLRAPARGILLIGPPGNGKTLLAKAVATESKQTFFNISASILTSKWVGEGEKLVRALFACARELQPSIIFIDEVDSILSARKDSEHDAIRRLKTEFLVQFDGVGTNGDDRILVMGATNLPQELDTAALRRFPKRIMIPLPDAEARMSMLKKLLGDHKNAMSEHDFEEIATLTEGYSGSDLAALAKDAAMGPIRDIDPSRVPTLKNKEIRPIAVEDFVDAIRRIRPSVPESSLQELKNWAAKYADCS